MNEKRDFLVRQIELNFTTSHRGEKLSGTGPQAIEDTINEMFVQDYTLWKQFVYGLGHEPGYNEQKRVVLIFRHNSLKV